MEHRRYEHLLFDADGTLFDFNLAQARAFDQLARHIGIPLNPQSYQAYHDANSKVWIAFEQGLISMEHLKIERFRQFLKTIGSPLDPEEASSTYISLLSRQGILIDGALGLVQSLARASFNLVLVTNGISEVQRGRLEVSGMDKLFNHVVISEEIGAQKPAPEFFEAMSRVTGISKEQFRNALVIGDSLTSDISGGNRAGIDTCWYNPGRLLSTGEELPTYEIGKLDELMEILAN